MVRSQQAPANDPECPRAYQEYDTKPAPLAQTPSGRRVSHWSPQSRTPNMAQPPQGQTRWCPERRSGGFRRQTAVIDLFSPDSGAARCGYRAIWADL